MAIRVFDIPEFDIQDFDIRDFVIQDFDIRVFDIRDIDFWILAVYWYRKPNQHILLWGGRGVYIEQFLPNRTFVLQ